MVPTITLDSLRLSSLYNYFLRINCKCGRNSLTICWNLQKKELFEVQLDVKFLALSNVVDVFMEPEY